VGATHNATHVTELAAVLPVTMETVVGKCASRACSGTTADPRANVKTAASAGRRRDPASARPVSSEPRVTPLVPAASTARTASWSATAVPGEIATRLAASASKRPDAPSERPGPTACQTVNKDRGVKTAKTSVNARTTGFATRRPEIVPADSDGPDSFVKKNVLMAVGVRIASWNVVAIRMRYVTASTAGVNAKTASTVHLAKTLVRKASSELHARRDAIVRTLSTAIT